MSKGTKPPLIVSIVWDEDLRFSVQARDAQFVLDGNGLAGPSPMQTLAAALAGCMGMDVISMLVKGRHEVRRFSARLVGFRADGTPARLTDVELRFIVEGSVPADAVARAIQLSREKYCSVWHSMRQDIDLRTSFEIAAAGGDGSS